MRTLELLYIALTLACSRTSVCIGFLVGPITITGHRGKDGSPWMPDDDSEL